jgi:DNA-binding CsgD family transcriptional regulator/tetratricopeptide (TPR) repeat protein
LVVGREFELDRLRRALDDVRHGAAGCLLLAGEGGVGKTRLVTEVAADARRSGMAVLAGRAPVTTPLAFSVVAEALRSWLRGHPTGPAAPAFDAGLRLVLPEWQPASPTPTNLTDAQLRLLALEGVVRVVQQIASTNGAALVVLDDLHAADPESLEVLRYLASAAVDHVLVLGALRLHESAVADDVVRALQRDGIADIVDVEPLEQRSVTDLLSALLDADPPDELVADVVTRTDGVPLLVEEVLDAHVRSGSVAVGERGAEWRGGDVVISRTIRDMVEGRLRQMTARCREVVVAAAVLGDLDPALLASVTDQPLDDVGDAIAAGIDAGLLETVTSGVTFRHAVIREAVVDVALPHVVAALHRRGADALAGAGSRDATLLERRAHHLLQIDEPDQAAELLVAAASQRLDQHALLGAEALATRALEVARSPSTRAAASDVVARALALQGRWTDALAFDEHAAVEFGETPERRRRMASCAVEAARPEVATVVIERAIADGDDSPQVHVIAGRLAMTNGDARSALAAADAALARAIADRDVAAQCAALELRGRALDFEGQRAEARRVWTEQADTAKSAGLTDLYMRALVQLSKLEVFDGAEPDRLYEAVEVAARAGAFVEQAWAEENLAIALIIQGDPKAGLRVLDEAIPRCRALRLDELPYLLAACGGAYSLVDPERADALFEEAEQLAPTIDLAIHTTGIRADTALRMGRYDDAVVLFEKTIEFVRSLPGGMPTDAAYFRPMALACAGRKDDAAHALEEANELPGDITRWHGRPVVRAAAEALLAGDEAGVDAAIASATGRMPFDLALIRIVAADVLHGPSRVRWLTEALAIYESAEIDHSAARVRQLLRDAGGPVPRKRKPTGAVPAELAAHGVTAREAEVMQLLGEGLSNATIAERLYVSVRTVETHVSSLLAKLHVEGRGQLTAMSAAIDFGATSPSS